MYITKALSHVMRYTTPMRDYFRLTNYYENIP
ncbi:hypothetical protein EDB95_1554 [Dinghuibacter silviterrae]|uniref:Uncharacterized protein n=1 Tax=Dinghuibacter silviterrae TaxID=1539049 RepID=A0A4R8DRD3_9BACT|nr:hypothetical protein EDB95_1554 [Dinghuibacter silviterrae]